MKPISLIKSVLIAGAIIFHAAQSQAGSEAHGGNVVICSDHPAVTLDYYNAALPTVSGPADIVDLSKMTSDDVVRLFRSRLDGSPFQKVFDEAVRHFGPLALWPTADLKDVNDGGEPYFLPSSCKRVTAATRQKNTIYVDPSVFFQLSEAQKGLLYVHEMLYFISGQDTSTPVREALRILLRNTLTQEMIAQAVHYIGAYYGYEMLRLHTVYVPKDESQNPNVTIQFNGINRETHLVSAAAYKWPLEVTSAPSMDCSPLTFCTWSFRIRDSSNGHSDTFSCKVTILDENEIILDCPNQGISGARFLQNQS